MLQLWRAVGFLAANKEILNDCISRVGNGKGIHLTDGLVPEKLKQQPTREAIDELNTILNKQNGLHLGLYELSELNRWFQRPDLPKILDQYWSAVSSAQDGTDPAAFQETIGVLLYDKIFAFNFAASTQPGELLAEHGFRVDNQVAENLKKAIASNAEEPVKQFFLLWSGSSCLARLSYYENYVYPNS